MTALRPTSPKSNVQSLTHIPTNLSASLRCCPRQRQTGLFSTTLHPVHEGHLPIPSQAVILGGMFFCSELRYSDQRTLALICAITAILLCWHAAPEKQDTLQFKQYQFRIHLDTATHGELQTLPGIGPKLAESIVQYRDQHIPMREVDALLHVRGIGPKRFNALKPYFVD